MAEDASYVGHPLWARYLRWCTIHRRHHDAEQTSLVLSPHHEIPRLESLPDYKYCPLPSPAKDARIVELLPGKFDDDITIRIHHVSLTPPPQREEKRATMAQVKQELPPGWEVFQTLVDRRFVFCNMKTGKLQWEHPSSPLHPRKTSHYEVPFKDGSFPPYETLSYVWGSPDKSSVVAVDRPGEEGPARLAVTESLITALRYLRHKQQKRNLWIDAICLNQADYTELSQQVPRRGEIYRLAYTGIAWLGVEGNGSSHALETLRHLGSQVVAEENAGLLFCAPDATEAQWFDPDVELPYPQQTWDAVVALLQRPWFTRLWVVQEIHPGAVLQCGQDTIGMASFAEAQSCLYCKTRPHPGLRSQMTQVDGTLSRFWTLALPRLLYRAATFKQCADPRDKIYGLLELAPSRFAHTITVDYAPGNTAVDVFQMAVLGHARVTGRLEHFHNCFTAKPGRREIGAGPSWVPDWVSACPGETYVPSQFVAGASRAHFRYSETAPAALDLLGVRFGRVTHVTEPLPQGLDRWDAIRHVRRWQPDDLDHAVYGPSGEPLRKAYALTLICNGVREHEPDWIVSSTEEWAQQGFAQALFGENAPVDTEDFGEAAPDPLRQDVSDALQCCAERRFFRTDDGYIGLGPWNTQPGDVLAVPLGCPNALVLRPEGPSVGNHFSVVGECFVHGLHDVEALLGRLPRPWRGVAAWAHGDRRVLRFVNEQTREMTEEDPRLTASPSWERCERVLDRDDPTIYDFFKNTETGEIINYDPRLEPEALDARGVNLTWFALI
ncbi:unnamed protein product [Discula destructiva]